jgi:hypothetical protein
VHDYCHLIGRSKSAVKVSLMDPWQQQTLEAVKSRSITLPLHHSPTFERTTINMVDRSVGDMVDNVANVQTGSLERHTYDMLSLHRDYSKAAEIFDIDEDDFVEMCRM